ncbi:ComF family protein [Sphingomonas swuensis]|uniref:ComF family protein n=2 Tax=Sphingomonas swuensis TaxID=977800 RepID=A0ABP7SXX2_9SPHN
MLDFSLPPRCAGCGDIVAEVDLFCNACWGQLRFLTGGCSRCGVPLAPADDEVCGDCTAGKNALHRSRAALAYGEIPRGVAMRLKYGRKIALARTMAIYMKRPLADLSPNALLVPVPLHRWRLWQRGFNQAVLIARALGREVDPDLLRRVRATPRLKGLNPSQRKATVRGAFAVRPGESLKNRDIILVDDVITTGSTAEACARALRKAGARQVELLAWARVLK